MNKTIAFSGGRDLEVPSGYISMLVCAYDGIYPNFNIVVGDCPTGVDSAVRSYAATEEESIKVFNADWKTKGRAAGPIRNREMLETADVLVAIWDGHSKGTGNAIKIAGELGLDIHIHRMEVRNE